MSEDFRVLASRRLNEALALHTARQWSGAYYLAGYSVECGLKACILKSIRPYCMPDKKTINEVYIHDLQKLVRLASLESALTYLRFLNQYLQQTGP